ncbi:hypothetical protein Nans01_12910 [Nocardiopsis ansamitocini]|uniref:Uncharacterized protein n=1 Tax=Nocardiopsis ansamitocini TaxID=1670832 RepID=A0A9W6UID3_9ACTN|nr:hypothetical protein Nans01_12910 [Nocardiopsis ansamitocini]
MEGFADDVASSNGSASGIGTATAAALGAAPGSRRKHPGHRARGCVRDRFHAAPQGPVPPGVAGFLPVYSSGDCCATPGSPWGTVNLVRVDTGAFSLLT